MTLEEAIIHSREVAREKRTEGCIECAKEHEQLAEWLEELQTLRKVYDFVCEYMGASCCCKYDFRHKCDSDCATHWDEFFMKKAREGNEIKA